MDRRKFIGGMTAAADSLVPGRPVHIVEGKYADIIMLDSLQHDDDKST